MILRLCEKKQRNQAQQCTKRTGSPSPKKDRSSQVSDTPDPQHRRSAPLNMPALPTNIPLAYRLRQSSSNSKHQLPGKRNYCIDNRPCPYYAPITTTTILNAVAQNPRVPPLSKTATPIIFDTIFTAMTNTTTSTTPATDRNTPDTSSTDSSTVVPTMSTVCP
ncbi:hypothetical protein SprV_0602165000 [Sparganum proliferum]